MTANVQRISITGGHIDMDRAQVLRDGQSWPLTRTELKLLQWFVAHPDRTHTLDDLLVNVWGYRPGMRSRTVYTTMRRLREKVERQTAEPAHLQTVYGIGYRFVAQATAEPSSGLSTEPVPLLGREADLQGLQDRLSAAALVWLIGPEGIGKSRLVEALVARREGRHAVVLCGTLSDEASLIEQVALSLQVVGSGADDLRRSLQRVLCSGLLLILVDPPPILDAAVARLAQPGGQVLVVGTRAPMAATVQVLDGLAPSVAASLLEQHATLQVRQRLADAGEDARVRLLRQLQGNPLAIQLAAARLEMLTVAQLTERLTQSTAVLGVLAEPFLLAVSERWPTLDGPVQDALRVLAASPRRLYLDELEARFGLGALDLLHRLRNLSLVWCRSAGPGQGMVWGLHLGVRRAVQHLSTSQQQSAAHLQHAQCTARVADDLSQAITVASFSRLKEMYADLMACAEHYATADPPLSARCALGVVEVARQLLPMRRLHAVLATISPMLDAESDLVLAARIALLQQIVGYAHGTLSSPEALLEGWIRRLEQAGEEYWATMLSLHLAGTLANTMTQLDRSQQIFAQHAQHPSLMLRAHAVYGLSLVAHCRNEWALSEKYSLQSLRYASAENLPVIRMVVLVLLGNTYRQTDRFIEAESVFRDALDAASQIGGPRTTAYIRMAMGMMFMQSGSFELAEASFQEGIQHAQVSGNLRAEGNLKRCLSWQRWYTGQQDAALTLAQEALSIVRASGHEMRALWTVGLMLLGHGDAEGARQHVAQALMLRSDETPEHQEVRLMYAATLVAVGRLEEARAELARCTHPSVSTMNVWVRAFIDERTTGRCERPATPERFVPGVRILSELIRSSPRED